MKKILLILLCLPFIGFGQSLNDIKNTKIIGIDHHNSYITFGGANADDPIFLYQTGQIMGFSNLGGTSMNNLYFSDNLNNKNIYLARYFQNNLELDTAIVIKSPFDVLTGEVTCDIQTRDVIIGGSFNSYVTLLGDTFVSTLCNNGKPATAFIFRIDTNLNIVSSIIIPGTCTNTTNSVVEQHQVGDYLYVFLTEGPGQTSRIIKYDRLFNEIWSKRLVTNYNGNHNMIIDEQENIYVSYWSYTNHDVDPDSTSLIIAGSGSGMKNFTVSFDSSGFYRWNYCLVSNGGGVQGQKPKIIGNQLILECGHWGANVELNPNGSSINVIPDKNIVALDKNTGIVNNYLSYDHGFFNTGVFDTEEIFIVDEKVYVRGIGYNNGTVFLGQNQTEPYSYGDNGVNQIIVEYDTLLNFVNARGINTDMYANDGDIINTSNGTQIFSFRGSQFDFVDTNQIYTNYISGSGHTVCMVQFEDCITDSHTTILSSCNSYSLNGVTYTSSGIYSNTYTNVSGCDSVHIIDLTINLPSGCNDPLYLEYDASVTCSDASACLTLIVNGCTDVTACNYDATANVDDGSCYSLTIETNVSHVSCYTGSDGEIGVSLSGDPNNTLLPFTFYINGVQNLNPYPYDSLFTGLSEGMYIITGIDYESCAITDTVYVNAPQFPLIANIIFLCDNNSTVSAYANATGGSPFSNGSYIFEWYNTNWASIGLGDSILNLGFGDYFLEVTDSNGCQASIDFTVLFGCMDALACNYDTSVICDDGSCILPDGCTDPLYLEYDATAQCDDGSCATLIVSGCTDVTACNYDATANVDDGSCILPDGCTNPLYLEYDATAQCDDGSCATLIVNGCTDSLAFNYNPLANTDDGSCVAVVNGCTDATAFNYNANANIDDGSCVAVVNGCTDSIACNYDAAANTDNGSCNYSTTSTATETACDSFEWNGTTYDSSGTYSYTGSYSGTSNNFSLNISYNQFISIPALYPSASNTLSAWIEFPLPDSEDPLTWNTLFSKQGGNYHHLYFGVNGELGIYNGGSHVGCGYYASNISPGFHYITAVSNNSQTQFYVDGINVGSVGQVITEPIGIIGNFDGNGTQPIGNIDDVSIWSYNLSNQEILNYMYCSPIGSESGLTAYWNFESGNGLTAYNQTIHAHDGIITGANYDTIVPSQSCQLTNSNGCDSTAILNLTINNLVSTLNTVSICSGDSFTVGTNTYDTDNTYTDVLTTINGCDSTVTTILTIDPLGCTDSSAFNYNASAVCDDSSCIVTVNGCTDTAAFNYNFSANVDDGSCIATILGCTNQFAYNYNAAANTDDGSCLQFILGCTNQFAYNYNFSANVDDGSCVPFIFGCTDSLAFNFYSAANSDDGSCTYLSCNEDSPTGLFASDVIHNRATINWDNMNSSLCIVDQYRIRYRETGTSSWSAKTMSGPLGSCTFASQKTDKLILNLTANTTYEYHMKAWYCGGSNSSWSAIATFTTLANCPNVGNLAVYGATPTKATFTWDASNGVYAFVRLKARVDSISNPTGADFFQIGGAGVSYGTYTKNKNNLTPSQTYRGQARTYCDPNGGGWKSLSWTPLVYWTQPTQRIEGGNAIANLAIYPNPSKDVFNITFKSERVQDLRVRVLNIMGEEIIIEELEQYIGEYTKQINLEDIAKGIYFLEIETNDGVINKKLILQ